MFRILAVNPGSTSTKAAVYDDRTLVKSFTLRHTADEISSFPTVLAQFDFRKQIIFKTLADAGITLSRFDAVIGRGGVTKPIRSGVYEVNAAMLHDLRNAKTIHASNLGGLLAYDIAQASDARAFVADPVVVDEYCSEARFTGLPDVQRISLFHALNQKAKARKYAESIGRRYEDLNLIVVHMGGGISLGAHLHGQVVDTNNCLYGEGPFSPERCGTLPATAVADMCFSGKYTRESIVRLFTSGSGLVAHLGTNNAADVESRAESGDKHAREVMDAMCYGVAKSIGSFAPVFDGKIDAIILTGGIAYSRYVCDYIKRKVSFLAPVIVEAGEDELEALAENARRALSGETEVAEYQ